MADIITNPSDFIYSAAAEHGKFVKLDKEKVPELNVFERDKFAMLTYDVSKFAGCVHYDQKFTGWDAKGSVFVQVDEGELPALSSYDGKNYAVVVIDIEELTALAASQEPN